ncbi:hypothetical protein J5N58_25095 [Rhizobium cremeum]|jgi:hypothetical protein|uniref:hypothetical protein n=1 Tax=Rhizobium cremeum TaxID=2813827 RepID=UPI001FD19C51|nr:hypothetical protein [Rhizobium cremeum]MCJ7997871.1 hypothetical protein [Rhizobium cremeum]MCJ8002964.1 hypothetical protein [Rhizobium cremeum]
MNSLGGRNRDRKQGREHLPGEFDVRTRLGGLEALERDAGEPVAVILAGRGVMVRVYLIACNATRFGGIGRFEIGGIREIGRDGV